ncbi:MAG: hypothetical protein WC253_01030 [Sulfurovaceae bacterium]|nr:hypothetical protein [Sulfurovaceae bacterium]
MNEKEALLKEIETLISYGKEEPTVNPELLQYLEIKDLESIKESLLRKVGILSDEDKKWLEQFKKYE